MTKQITIILKGESSATWPDGSLVHRFRNFGEDLYREFASSGQAEISLEEIDSAVSELRVFVKGRSKVGVVSSSIERILQQHKLDDEFMIVRGGPSSDR